MRSSKSRHLPTGHLSPIHESDKELLLVARSTDGLEELNNSSVLPVESSEICNERDDEEQQKVVMTPYHHDNYADLYAGRTIENSVNKTIIESCSGRKQEDTEVLKQKYLNSEIRDLPGKMKNTFHHRRLLKTRSSYCNIGSPDIKNHLHKMHMISTLKTGNSCENLTPKQLYRCRKLSEFRIPTHILKRSMAELLYGDNAQNDTNPEVTTLFEDYVDECERIARSKTVSCTEGMDADESYINGAVHAFLCDFLQELPRDISSAEPAADDCQLESIGLNYNPSSDQVTKSQTQRYLIACKQDITHKHLRLWEKESRDGNRQKEDEKQSDMTLHRQVSTDSPNETETQHTTTPVATGDSIGCPAQSDPTSFHESRMCGRKDIVDKNGQVEHLVTQKEFSPQMREKSLNQHKYKATDLSNMCEDDMNIVRLAKHKLEHRVMASFAIDEAYPNKLKTRCVTDDLKPGTRVEKHGNKWCTKTSDGPSINKLYTNKLDDFEGWGTDIHSYNDYDNLETSEFLHPIESLDKLYEAPMRTPSSSTSLYSPIDPTTSTKVREVTPDVPMVLDNARNERTTNDSYYETYGDSEDDTDIAKNAMSVKHEAAFSNDNKKAARLIKLRLTKYNDLVGNDTTFVDKSLANVPLSPCINYNIETSMRSNVTMTTSINLSEKLAQQLREMSQNNDTLRTKGYGRSTLNTTKPAKQSMATIGTPDMLSINGDNINLKIPEVGLRSDSISFQDMNSPNTLETEKKTRKTIPRQYGNVNDVGERRASEKTDLPSLSVKAFANNVSKYNEIDVEKHGNEEQRYSYSGVAVRAAVCTSPYTFDKQDPSMLLLKAKPLSELHSVCTSCGGISEKQESPRFSSRTTNVRRKKKNCKLKETHKQWCGSHAEDTWKLDRGCNETEGLPKVAVERISHSPEIKKSSKPAKPVTHVKSGTPNMILAPTSRKQNCEEMSINFMDRNIKFRFQREETNENLCKTGSDWLKNISAPTCRDRFECPVTSETRIYREDIRRSNRVDSTSYVSTPISSPYLDYCKQRAELRAVRHDLVGRKLTGAFSDTRSPIDIQDQNAQKSKNFPVIPMKKNKEKHNRRSATECCRKNGRDDRSDLFVKPTKPTCLPEIKSEIYAFSKENVNNNVVSCASIED